MKSIDNRKNAETMLEDLKPELLRLFSSHPQYGSIGIKLSFQKGIRSTTEITVNISKINSEDSNNGI